MEEGDKKGALIDSTCERPAMDFADQEGVVGRFDAMIVGIQC